MLKKRTAGSSLEAGSSQKKKKELNNQDVATGSEDEAPAHERPSPQPDALALHHNT